MSTKTDIQKAFTAISAHGCDCDAVDCDDTHTCIGGLCEVAIKALEAELEENQKMRSNACVAVVIAKERIEQLEGDYQQASTQIQELAKENQGLKEAKKQTKGVSLQEQELVTEQVEKLLARALEAESENERLKCCGNCEHYHCDSYSNRCIIAIGGNNTRARKPCHVCDEWQPTESRGV